MNDMQAAAKILVVIRESQKVGAINMDLLSEKNLKISEKERDALAIAMLHANLIEGIVITEDIYNTPDEVLWNLSHPRVTFEGIKFMNTDIDFKKAVKDIAISMAQSFIGALCSNYI